MYIRDSKITMKKKKPMITDTGLVIDPDDDVEIIYHDGYVEIKRHNTSEYCKYICN